MKLTPLDIKKQEFKKVLRGYDTVEVDTFMDMMANEFEDMLRAQKEMRDRIVELEIQLKDYRQIEKTLQQTLMQVQETTGRTYESARKEAEVIVREAEQKSQMPMRSRRHLRLSLSCSPAKRASSHRPRTVPTQGRNGLKKR